MDESVLLNGLLFILSSLFGILTLLLSYLLALLGLLVSPFWYLINGLLAVVLWPLRVFLKFEAILLFISGAVLTGIILGLFLYFTGDTLTQLLRLYPSPEPSTSAQALGPKDEPYDWQSRIEDEYNISSTILEEEETSQVSE